VSFRDITHNPDVIRALRELSKRGIYGKLEKVRDNYGVILFDVKATGEYIMNEVKEKWTEPYYDQENRTIVFHINIPEYAAIPVPAEAEGPLKWTWPYTTPSPLVGKGVVKRWLIGLRLGVLRLGPT